MVEPEKKRILLVDDERPVLTLLKIRFEKMGHVVAAVDNGTDALDMAKRLKPHLIVLDQLLPGKKGTEICRGLKANPDTASIPVLFFTAHSGMGFEEECAGLGAAIVLYKPVVAELIQAVQIVLSGKRLRWLEGE